MHPKHTSALFFLLAFYAYIQGCFSIALACGVIGMTSVANHSFGQLQTLDRVVVNSIGLYFALVGLTLGPEFVALAIAATALCLFYWVHLMRAAKCRGAVDCATREQQHALYHFAFVLGIAAYVTLVRVRCSAKERAWF